MLTKFEDYIINTFFTKKYYWYQLHYTYKDPQSGKLLFDYHHQVGLEYRKSILNDRELKKVRPPLHLDESFTGIKHLLCNGNYTVNVTCYLGKFPNPYK